MAALVVIAVISFLDHVNRVAHTLAAEGGLCNHGDDVSWDFTPPCVSNSVASDAAGSLS
jgi:hypothetical protein